MTHSYRNFTPSRWCGRRCLPRIGSTITSTIRFPLGTELGRGIINAPGCLGSWRGVGSSDGVTGITVFSSKGFLNAPETEPRLAKLDGRLSLTRVLPDPEPEPAPLETGCCDAFLSRLLVLDTETNGLFVGTWFFLGEVRGAGAGTVSCLLVPRDCLPEIYSFFEISESTSTSFPPIERTTPSFRADADVYAARPISLPETSCR